MRATCLVALAILSGPALAQTGASDESEVVRPVVSEILSGTLRSERSFTGLVAASGETDLGFTVPGRLAERPVSDGALVAAGDILALLDPVDLDTDLSGAEAGVASAQAQLTQARDAEARVIELVARTVDTQVRQDAAETARIAAEARLEQALATRDSAVDRRASATLLAPTDGVVTSVLAEPGATLSAGQPVLRLATTEGREVLIDLTEADLAGLAADAAFDVALVVDPSITARATVALIAPTAASETRTRQVRLRLEAPPEGFRLGALVTATMEGTATLMTLPGSAILTTDGADAVWVVARPGGRVSLVPVTTEPALGGRIAILSGVEVGQEVVTKGVHSLVEGQLVGPQVAG